MGSNLADMERHARTLRAWQLAILRFAATLDNADRLTVLMIAAEIDGLGPKQDNEAEFRFFRRTSAELCGAILRPNELTSPALRQYLARIDDDRLKRIFAAAVQTDQPQIPSVSAPARRNEGLWRGLSSRSSRY